MNRRESIYKILSVFLGAITIIAALIGIFYSSGGIKHTVVSMYGNKVELYGNGIYAFNSILAVANRLGADVTGILTGVALIIFTFLKAKKLWVLYIKTALAIYLAYYSVCLVFGIAMNSLYFIYVTCLGVSLFISTVYIKNLLKNIEIPEVLKKRRMTGTGLFLIIVGVITAILWVSVIIPAIINNVYGPLLGIQTTEVTYGIDLSITCPIFIICGIWVLKKRDIGYKLAPLLLNIMVGIAVLVISQRMFCSKLGIDVPIEALIGFVISFVILGIISLNLVIKLLRQIAK